MYSSGERTDVQNSYLLGKAGRALVMCMSRQRNSLWVLCTCGFASRCTLCSQVFSQATPFAKQLSPKDRFAYMVYLGRLFDVGYQLMPHGQMGEKDHTLGKHCFSAILPLTVEFYGIGEKGAPCTEYGPPAPPPNTKTQ